jgi:hypothetical protein
LEQLVTQENLIPITFFKANAASAGHEGNILPFCPSCCSKITKWIPNSNQSFCLGYKTLTLYMEAIYPMKYLLDLFPWLFDIGSMTQ